MPVPDSPSSDKPLTGFVSRLTAMTRDDDAHEIYESWAPGYEQDMLNGFGYNAHTVSANALAGVCSERSSSIIDMGCGTGLVGQALTGHGFTVIDGADASPQMLRHAHAKGVYRHLLTVDLTAPQALPAATYDAAIAVGVFGGGHIGPEYLKSFALPVRPGGVIVLFANGIPFIEDDYRAHLLALESAGLWHLEDIHSINYMDKIERPGWLVVARRGER
jgi:SAM-dependent methyltransferase